MFEWLEKEIRQIKTNKFHLTQPLPDVVDEIFPRDLYLSLPPSYLTFMSRFGWAKLYRMRGYYLINVHPPYRVVSKDGEALIEFGWSDYGGLAYFKRELLQRDHETPIFEWDEDDEEPKLMHSANHFNRWLASRCRQARNTYSKIEWEEILAGAPPFTEEEQAIVEARKQYQWQVVGFGENGDIQILMKNNSNLVLPYLSLGVERKNGTEVGWIWLAVGDVKPQHEKIVEHNCYKNFIAREDVEIYPLPDPDPEDRAVYWEFRK